MGWRFPGATELIAAGAIAPPPTAAQLAATWAFTTAMNAPGRWDLRYFGLLRGREVEGYRRNGEAIVNVATGVQVGRFKSTSTFKRLLKGAVRLAVGFGLGVGAGVMGATLARQAAWAAFTLSGKAAAAYGLASWVAPLGFGSRSCATGGVTDGGG